MLKALCTAVILATGIQSACAGAVEHHVRPDNLDIRVEFDDAAYTAGSAAVLDWVGRSAGIVTGYYGTFPAHSLRILLEPQSGAGVRSGKTWGYHGGFIRMEVGRDVTASQLMNDWVLVHEMTHLALPDVGEDHDWLAEGLAVYIEGIERVQAGNRSAEDVFAEQLRQMPKGLPQPGDRGLDHTHTWARTYWGGAMFCLLADVEIHQRTGNRMGLQDAMREVLRASGGMAVDWPIDKVFATADAATGTTVMSQLYAQMKDAPVTPDLPHLWQQLGVGSADTVTFNDAAPLAAVRRAIMTPRAKKT
jgi:hypothetical protein